MQVRDEAKVVWPVLFYYKIQQVVWVEIERRDSSVKSYMVPLSERKIVSYIGWIDGLQNAGNNRPH